MPERFVMYADIEVHDQCEGARLHRIGPFSPEEGLEDDPETARIVLEENLAFQGDNVLGVKVVPL